jgi:hypothetical protein
VLLLVTLALVLASAVLLILGFVNDALTFIYVSMLCAGVAAVALFVFARLARRRAAALAGADVAGHAAAGDDRTGKVEVVGGHEDERGETGADDGHEDEQPPPEAAGPDPWAEDQGRHDWGDEVGFPIEDYDDLRVAQILPLLSRLDLDELQEVRDRESAGKARVTVLDRIDDRLGRAGGAKRATKAPPAVEAAPPADAAPPVEPAGSFEETGPMEETGPTGSPEAPAPRPVPKTE